uniref:NELL2-interacting cell ontogeny regulator 1 n=1 Tax=Nomascus leucogenys TaxID=61853 RepID=A0A2I3GVI6_NOMLE
MQHPRGATRSPKPGVGPTRRRQQQSRARFPNPHSHSSSGSGHPRPAGAGAAPTTGEAGHGLCRCRRGGLAPTAGTIPPRASAAQIRTCRAPPGATGCTALFKANSPEFTGLKSAQRGREPVVGASRKRFSGLRGHREAERRTLGRGPLLLLLLSLALLGARARAEPAGSAVPAQSRPCVDCHAFEFMQRALQDLRKTAYSLDARTETLLLQAERRALCACWPAGH